MIEILFQCQTGTAMAKTFIQYQVGKIGRDWCVLITGGESHIGALICSNKLINENFSYTLATHKEDVLVTEAYQQLSQLVKNEIVFISGVHYDQINSNQINTLLNNNRQLIKQTAEFLKSA